MCKSQSEGKATKVELKYCEHCGGLWVRECGSGVYCAKCEPKVADLPISKKRAGRVMLPKLDRSLVENRDRRSMKACFELEAVGGVA